MLSNEDKEFLKTYNADKYKHPSVTVDMLIFTVVDGTLCLMLIERKNSPYKNCWALPGGFVNIDESIKTAALRELKEETNVNAIGYLEQLGAYGEVERDPRTRVISIAYIALIPSKNITKEMRGGDDAKVARLFNINNIFEMALAFDHAQIIKDGMQALKNRLLYTDIAFNLVEKEFTLFDLQKVYEAILGKELNKGNFRRTFIRNYVNTGKAEYTGNVSNKYQRPAKLYRLKGV